MAGGNITEIAGGSITTTVNKDFSVFSDTLQLNSGAKVSLHGQEKGVNFTSNPLDAPAGKATVTKAYFARKIEKKTIKSEENYTVLKGDTQNSIAEAKGVDKQDIPKKITPGKVLKIRHYEVKHELQRTKSAILGSKIFLVAETIGLAGTNINFQILGSNNTTFVKPDEVVSILAAGNEKTEFSAKVGEYITRTEFYKPETFFINKAIVEVEFKPSDDNTKKDWVKKINDSTEKTAYFHLTVKSDSEKEVQYLSDIDPKKAPSKDNGVFLDQKDLWLVLKTCFCNRELQKEDLILMGISEKKAKDFLDGINQAIKNYEINTCLRIGHFIAQIKHESNDFTATVEGWGPTAAQLGYEGRKDLGNTEAGDGKKFMGRGLVQITGRTNYTSYGTYKNMNFTNGENNLKLETSPYSVDSAGWFWKEHLGSTNLNDYADTDDAIYITYRINGGFNGYRLREENVKNIFNNIGSCANVDLTTKGTYKLSTSKCNQGKDGVWKFANLLDDENDSYSGDETSKTAYTRYIALANPVLEQLKAKKKLSKSELSDKVRIEGRIAVATEKSK